MPVLLNRLQHDGDVLNHTRNMSIRTEGLGGHKHLSSVFLKMTQTPISRLGVKTLINLCVKDKYAAAHSFSFLNIPGWTKFGGCTVNIEYASHKYPVFVHPSRERTCPVLFKEYDSKILLAFGFILSACFHFPSQTRHSCYCCALLWTM